MKKSKIPFGIRMAALRQARKEVKEKMRKDKQLQDDLFRPVSPFDAPDEGKIVMKPLEATTPTPIIPQKVEVHVSTPLERTIERLRQQASKI